MIALVLVLAIILIYWYVVRFAFNQCINSHKKNKEESMNLLTKRGIYDIREYDFLEFENLEIESDDGCKLKGYYLDFFPESKKFIIISHGYTGNHYMSLQFLNIFKSEGFNVLLIDVRAHGDSGGSYPTYGILEQKDLDKWVDLMKVKVGDDITIGLHGQSMGAATVLMYGGKHHDKINFIIADCGYSNGKELLKYKFKMSKVPFAPFYPILNLVFKIKCKFSMNDVSPIDDIKNSEIPTLFIHGTKDITVPVWMSKEMYKAKKGNKNEIYIVEGANHVCSYDVNEEEYKKTVKNFIKNVLG